MAKVKDVKVGLDFTHTIEQFDVISSMLIEMGENLAKMGEDISNALVTLRLLEMTKDI